MNISQFTGPYLKKELKMLADLGYDTIIWEVENNIQWETCPECVSPDAFSKAEFKEILAYCRGLGLEPIPLLQTLGHCEYVLQHDKYKPLAEVPDRIDQYCPRHPEIVPFLEKWIGEYLEVFGDVRYFHLGADEAYTLGECPRCRAYVAEHSLSSLFIDHINAVARPLVAKGIRPIIWGDMLLNHPEALDSLSRNVVVYDWLYTRFVGADGIWVWGQGTKRKDEIDAATRTRFGSFLYPLGDEPGRDPDPFYQAEYLAAHGFDVVVCPSSSCWGDSVFAPRTFFHMRNTFDSFKRGMSGAARRGGPDELDGPSLPLGASGNVDRAAEVHRRESLRRPRRVPDRLRPGAFRRRRPGLLCRRGPAREPGPVQLRRRPRVLQGGPARPEGIRRGPGLAHDEGGRARRGARNL